MFVIDAFRGVWVVRLNGADACGSVVFTVMEIRSFGMMRASYSGSFWIAAFTLSGSCK